MCTILYTHFGIIQGESYVSNSHLIQFRRNTTRLDPDWGQERDHSPGRQVHRDRQDTQWSHQQHQAQVPQGRLQTDQPAGQETSQTPEAAELVSAR